MLSVSSNTGNSVASSICKVVEKSLFLSIAKKIHVAALPIIVLVGLTSIAIANAEPFYDSLKDCENACNGYVQRYPLELCKWLCQTS